MMKKKSVRPQKIQDYKEYLKAERIIKNAYKEVVSKLSTSPSMIQNYPEGFIFD